MKTVVLFLIAIYGKGHGTVMQLLVTVSLSLQVLGAELAILDEIDSGLDVDALQDVAKAVNGLLTPKNSVLMITHYQRLLDYIKPTLIHIMVSVDCCQTSLLYRVHKDHMGLISLAKTQDLLRIFLFRWLIYVSLVSGEWKNH